MDEVSIVQISDVHVGEREYKNPRHRLFAALNGHDDKLARELSSLLPTLGAAHVAVSGDLSRVGSAACFKTVRTYLGGQWPPNPPSQLSVGLGRARNDYSVILGNHDHWADARCAATAPAYNPGGFVSAFGSPVWGPVVLTVGNLIAELYGVDSSEGWALSGSRTALRQGGSITNLTALADLFQQAPPCPPGKQRVRVVLCHHAFDNVQGLTLPLDAASRQLLLNVAEANDVQVVFTGHTHYLDVQPYSVAGRTVWEVRSPSTLIAPRNPAGLGVRPFDPSNGPKIDANGFVLHRITLEGSPPTVHWYVKAYLWDGKTFVAYPDHLLFS